MLPAQTASGVHDTKRPTTSRIPGRAQNAARCPAVARGTPEASTRRRAASRWSRRCLCICRRQYAGSTVVEPHFDLHRDRGRTVSHGLIPLDGLCTSPRSGDKARRNPCRRACHPRNSRRLPLHQRRSSTPKHDTHSDLQLPQLRTLQRRNRARPLGRSGRVGSVRLIGSPPA